MRSERGVTVLFFASIRERLGTERLQWPLARDADAVIDALVAEHGEPWREALRAPNVIVAINQRVAEPSDMLHDGDELAFFPPVTGG
jgi:molybdopterin synthase sulfur carrier subunit